MGRLKERIWRLFDLRIRPLKEVLFNIIVVCGLAGGLAALAVSAVTAEALSEETAPPLPGAMYRCPAGTTCCPQVVHTPSSPTV